MGQQESATRVSSAIHRISEFLMESIPVCSQEAFFGEFELVATFQNGFLTHIKAGPKRTAKFVSDGQRTHRGH